MHDDLWTTPPHPRPRQEREARIASSVSSSAQRTKSSTTTSPPPREATREFSGGGTCRRPGAQRPRHRRRARSARPRPGCRRRPGARSAPMPSAPSFFFVKTIDYVTSPWPSAPYPICANCRRLSAHSAASSSEDRRRECRSRCRTPTSSSTRPARGTAGRPRVSAHGRSACRKAGAKRGPRRDGATRLLESRIVLELQSARGIRSAYGSIGT